jgi:hypothetical protein
MKFKFLIYMSFLYVLFPILLFSQTPIPISNLTVKNENIVYENLNAHTRTLKRNGSFIGVEFLNQEGKVKYQFPRNVKVDKNGFDAEKKKVLSAEILFNRRHHAKSFDPNEAQYFLINEPTRNYRGKLIGVKKWVNIDSNNLYVFSSNGDLIFSKTNAPYDLEAISGNGRYLVCIREISICDDNVDPGQNEDAENEIPSSENIYVYSVGGQKIFEKDLKTESGNGILISPSGEWLAFCDTRSNKEVAVNLKNKLEYKLPIEPGEMGNIFDDGSFTSHSSGQTFRLDPGNIIKSPE